MSAPVDPELPESLADIADFIRAALAEWKTPGAAVAVIADGAVILSEGFGFRDLAQELPVTPHTLFPIASCTKAFTGLGLALLVDEGKVAWDTPVREYLPTFRLLDASAGERITPRDLLTHRSGLPRHDFVWYGSNRTYEDIVTALRYLEPTQDLRAVFQYNNLMYVAAGYLAGHLAGRPWEDFVRSRIFEPLGMTDSLFSLAQMQLNADYAHPYKEADGKVTEQPFEAGAVGPAGGIISSVSDLSSWLRLHVANGRHGDAQLVSRAQMAELHAPHMVVPAPDKYAELPPPVSYGLGWTIHSYRGKTMIQHGGALLGSRSFIAFLPQHNIGVVVLTNIDQVPVPEIIVFQVIDRLLGLDPTPWSARYMAERKKVKAAQQKGKEKSATDRVPDTQPSHALESYAGEFTHPGYGTLSVERDGDSLLARYNGFKWPLQHYHYDTFRCTFEQWDLPLTVLFATDTRGDIVSVALPLAPTVQDIVFQRSPEREMTEQQYLKRCVGTYEIEALGLPVSVVPTGDTALAVSWPGLPATELIPYRGGEFRLRGRSGFSVIFTRTAEEAVPELLLAVPGAVYTAKRKDA